MGGELAERGQRYSGLIGRYGVIAEPVGEGFADVQPVDGCVGIAQLGQRDGMLPVFQHRHLRVGYR